MRWPAAWAACSSSKNRRSNMGTVDPQADVFQRLLEVHRLCPDLRLGQFLATVGMLGEDATGHSLGDIEDDEFTAALVVRQG